MNFPSVDPTTLKFITGVMILAKLLLYFGGAALGFAKALNEERTVVIREKLQSFWGRVKESELQDLLDRALKWSLFISIRALNAPATHWKSVLNPLLLALGALAVSLAVGSPRAIYWYGLLFFLAVIVALWKKSPLHRSFMRMAQDGFSWMASASPEARKSWREDKKSWADYRKLIERYFPIRWLPLVVLMPNVHIGTFLLGVCAAVPFLYLHAGTLPPLLGLLVSIVLLGVFACAGVVLGGGGGVILTRLLARKSVDQTMAGMITVEGGPKGFWDYLISAGGVFGPGMMGGALFMTGVALSAPLTLLALHLGRLTSHAQWEQLPLGRLTLSNMFFDGVALVGTMFLLAACAQKSFVLRFPLFYAGEILIAVVCSVFSLFIALWGTPQQLSLGECLHLIAGIDPRTKLFALSSLFWITHAIFLPIAFYASALAATWICNVFIKGFTFILKVNFEKGRNPLEITATFLVLLGIGLELILYCLGAG